MNRLRDLLNGSVTLNSAPDSNPCTWKGVTCDSSNSSVIKISLSGLSLSSPNVLSLLCQIDTLQHVDVSNNHLSSIPNQFFTDCGKNERLKLLNFSLNRLVGPLPTFQGFHGLESLDMSFNYLSGNIGSQLDELVSLKSLSVCTNHFNGSLPTSLGNSMALEELVLSRNHFEGGIPEKMLTYKNLNVIDLSENNLIGYNNLSGTIPADLLSSSNLVSVHLSYNALSGPLPTNISSSLVRLRLGLNSLNGTIPSATLATLQSLTYMELENNRLTGSIPRQLGSCRNLALLDLAQNELSGELPAELGNLANLQVLKLQMKHFSGLIPIQITQLQSLSTLNLSWNYLEGPIPSEISRLKKLTLLNLQGNKLTGSIPTSISSLTYLMEVQLGGNQLSNDIPKMPRNLQIALNLSSNLFKGPIPRSFGDLNNLEVLDLSNNQFSGEIPEFLTKLEVLMQLVLSNNQLSGVIPDFGSLVRVEASGNKDLRNNKAPSNVSYGSSRKRPFLSLSLAFIFSFSPFFLLSCFVSLFYFERAAHYIWLGIWKLSQNQTNAMNRLCNLLNGCVTWNSAPDTNPCTWNGVTCNSTGSSIIKISLSGLSVSSPNFLSLLCQIDTLQHIDLSGNLLSSIPNQFFIDCGKIEGLKLLNFSSNRLVGSLPAFHGFHGLESLDMSFNNLSGNIGLQLAQLDSLKSLNLSTNNFHGFLPTSLRNSMVLRYLVLENNKLTGTMPRELGSCRKLALLNLAQNELNGKLPAELGSLCDLSSLESSKEPLFWTNTNSNHPITELVNAELELEFSRRVNSI
ncbi:hypothetical protein L6164_007303 [Bauhinia variegata]|uniref:Uncharacterized protein n=1 Tax=Bauhinia variegata TaxID=167791 RepID=A0ACB9PDF8_BAUVA|nr:hypothetical protein L6164_007303 [Bauhinia variegata]